VRRIVVLVSLLSLIASACSSDGGASATPKVVLGSTLEPATLDITASSQGAIAEILLYNVLEGLVRIDNDGKIQPLLAQSYDVSEDGLTYTFELRQATFHDGSPLRAQDVVFTFNRHRSPKSTHPFKAQFDPVDTVRAVDQDTVRVTLKRFSANWLFNMALGPGVILKKSSIKRLADHPIGTGPFRFERWTRGDSITLVRNDDYWGAEPPLEEVVFKYIPDPNAMNNALLAGDIDIISRVTAPELIEALTADARFKIMEGLTNGEVILTMNNAKGPLKDARVRKAITHAIDRKGLVDAGYGGYGTLIGSHVPPTDPWYVDLADHVPFDVDKAKALLAEAGYADGFNLTLHLPPPSYARRSGEIIVGQLAEIGIKVKVRNVEFPQWLETVFTAGQFTRRASRHRPVRQPRLLLALRQPRGETTARPSRSRA
jgi:peptide/nickel transport system substrate-binding protein